MSQRGDETSGDLVATPVPGVTVDLRAAVRRGAVAVFDARGGPGSGPAVAGFDEVARVVGRGDARWDDVERGASRLLSRVRGDAAADVRLLGGLAFQPQAGRRGDDGLGDAVFVLPRWIWIDDARGARLVHVSPGERRPTGVLAEAAARFGGDELRDAASPSRRATSIDDGASAFVSRVEAACTAIAGGLLEKVVVGRRVELELTGGADVDATWRALAAREVGTIRLLWRDAGATLLAATPERLVVRDGDHVVVDALAGTAPRSGDDAAAIARLLESDKDRREHDVVVRSIVEALGGLGGRCAPGGAPVARSLRALHHLSTVIEPRFDTTPRALTLARALHPTPAVAGTPRPAATAFLREHEAGRGWFTGAFGWIDGAGDGAFAVILRALLLRDERAHLFAGTGIVRGSDPALELAETEAKLRAARGALGLEAAS